MALSGICLRQDKGSTLTIQELDDNFRIITGSIEEFKSCTVYVCGTQTIAGNKTFSNNVTIEGSTTIGNSDSDGLLINSRDVCIDTSAGVAACILSTAASSDLILCARSGTVKVCGNATTADSASTATSATTADTACCSNTICVDTTYSFGTEYGILFTSGSGDGRIAITDDADFYYKASSDLLVACNICATNKFCGNFCGEAATAVTVRAQSTTQNELHEIPFINYTTDGQYGLCVRSTVTFNPNSNELRTYGICGCGYICGSNVYGTNLQASTICSTGNATLGNQQSDTHQITGSVNISGSITTSDPIFPVILQYGKSGPVYNCGGSFTGGFTEYYVDTAGGANTCNNNGYYFGYDGEIVKISLTGRFLTGSALEEGIRAYPTVDGTVQTSMYAQISDSESPDTIVGASSTQASIPFVASKYLGAVIRVAGGENVDFKTVCGTDYSVTLFVKTTSL